MALTNGESCIIALLGMSIGFVLSSSVAHYIRKIRNKIHINVQHKESGDRHMKNDNHGQR